MWPLDPEIVCPLTDPVLFSLMAKVSLFILSRAKSLLNDIKSASSILSFFDGSVVDVVVESKGAKNGLVESQSRVAAYCL